MDWLVQFSMAMRVTASLGAYMSPAMCMSMVISVGETMKLFSTSCAESWSVPSRFPAIAIRMNRYETMNSPLECMCSAMTPIGA